MFRAVVVKEFAMVVYVAFFVTRSDSVSTRCRIFNVQRCRSRRITAASKDVHATFIARQYAELRMIYRTHVQVLCSPDLRGLCRCSGAAVLCWSYQYILPILLRSQPAV